MVTGHALRHSRTRSTLESAHGMVTGHAQQLFLYLTIHIGIIRLITNVSLSQFFGTMSALQGSGGGGGKTAAYY